MPVTVSRKRIIVTVVLAAAVLLIPVGERLRQVHAYGWEWTLTPSAAPPKVSFGGRDYRRGDELDGRVPDGYVRRGTTLGHGQIFSDAHDVGTSTVIYVKDGAHVHGYGLMGGP